MRLFFHPRGKIETIRPELPRMAVVPYSSDVLAEPKLAFNCCTGCTTVEDGSNGLAVSNFSAILIYFA